MALAKGSADSHRAGGEELVGPTLQLGGQARLRLKNELAFNFKGLGSARLGAKDGNPFRFCQHVLSGSQSERLDGVEPNVRESSPFNAGHGNHRSVWLAS